MIAGSFGEVVVAHADHDEMGAGAHLIHFIVVGVAFAAFMGYLWSENRRTGDGAARTWPTGERWLAITLLAIAGIGHIPVTPDHLREAPYMGVLFIAFTLATLGLAGVLVFTSSARVYGVAAAVCGAGVLMYVATRLVALPQLGDDVGAWLEPLGVLCVLTEISVVAVAVREIRRPAESSRRAPRHHTESPAVRSAG